MNDPMPQTSPLVTGAVLLAAGLLLRQWQPRALRLPGPPTAEIHERRTARVTRRVRDGIVRILPANLTGSIGRTLAIAGIGLILVRLLDMTVDDDATLF